MVYAYGLVDTVVSSGGTMSFNDATGDTWWIDPERSSGLAMRKVRASTYDKAQTDGYYFGNFYLEGRHMLFGGDAVVRSQSLEENVLTAREAMIAAAIAVLEPMASGAGSGTLNFIGGSSLTVRCDLALDPSGAWLKKFVMGLVSGS